MANPQVGNVYIGLGVDARPLAAGLRSAEREVIGSTKRMSRIANLPAANPRVQLFEPPPVIRRPVGLRPDLGTAKMTATAKAFDVRAAFNPAVEKLGAVLPGVTRFGGLSMLGAMGPVGAAAAGVGAAAVVATAGFRLITSEAQRARSILAGASASRLSVDQYQTAMKASGGDAEVLKGMALAMRDLKEQGDKASAGLRRTGEQIAALGNVRFPQSEQSMRLTAGFGRGLSELPGRLGEGLRQQTATAISGMMNLQDRLSGAPVGMSNMLASLRETAIGVMEDETKRNALRRVAAEGMAPGLRTPAETLRETLAGENNDFSIKAMLQSGALTQQQAARAAAAAVEQYQSSVPKSTLPELAYKGSSDAYRAIVGYQNQGETGDRLVAGILEKLLGDVPGFIRMVAGERGFKTRPEEELN